MLLDVFDQKIRKAFSNAAVQYDVLASLHREIGRELSAQLRDVYTREGRVLDIGSGTGWFANRLKHFFPASSVIALDLSNDMLRQSQSRAEDFNRLQANARSLPFKDESFDLITSNLAFQWLDDLRQGFDECRRCLADDGQLTLTLFGYETFHELFEALGRTCMDQKKKVPDFRRLPTGEQVQDILRELNFRDVEVKKERIQVRYPDMMSILKWIKDIGANALRKPEFLGKDVLKAADDYYNIRYKDRLGVFTTFEVVWVRAKR